MGTAPETSFFLNRRARSFQGASLQGGGELEAFAFHQRLPGYAATPLLEAPELACLLGVGQVLLKVESSRLGLPAFKILGASWAVYRALERHVGRTLDPWRTIDDLAGKVSSFGPLMLLAATDGNHGRAVARMAALLHLTARIFVPAGTAHARVDGIASEGAEVVIVDGTYDEAVERSAAEASDHSLVISDTSWAGYHEVPRWVTEGYSTIFREIDEELEKRGEKRLDLISTQFGIGALAAAVVRHYRRRARERSPVILSVEPNRAACALASMQAGRIVSIPGPHDSIMAGLNCGRPSEIAWPEVSEGIEAFIAIPDERAREAMRALHRIGIVAGETGAAGLAGLMELLTGADHKQRRGELQINSETRVLLFVTEGATDPSAYEKVIGLPNRDAESTGKEFVAAPVLL